MIDKKDFDEAFKEACLASPNQQIPPEKVHYRITEERGTELIHCEFWMKAGGEEYEAEVDIPKRCTYSERHAQILSALNELRSKLWRKYILQEVEP